MHECILDDTTSVLMLKKERIDKMPALFRIKNTKTIKQKKIFETNASVYQHNVFIELGKDRYYFDSNIIISNAAVKDFKEKFCKEIRKFQSKIELKQEIKMLQR